FLVPLAAFAPAPREAIPPIDSPVLARIAPAEGGRVAPAPARVPAPRDRAPTIAGPVGGIASPEIEPDLSLAVGNAALGATSFTMSGAPPVLSPVATLATPRIPLAISRMPLGLRGPAGALAVGPCDDRGTGSSSTDWTHRSHDGGRKSWTV